MHLITTITGKQMAETPYLDCRGCGVVLYGYKGASPLTLCADCRRFARFAYGTSCRQCGSTTVLCCTEHDGFETLFCSACDHFWCSALPTVELSTVIQSSTLSRWAGVERRLSVADTADTALTEFRKTG